jgi:hypothetical protein
MKRLTRCHSSTRVLSSKKRPKRQRAWLDASKLLKPDSGAAAALWLLRMICVYGVEKVIMLMQGLASASRACEGSIVGQEQKQDRRLKLAAASRTDLGLWVGPVEVHDYRERGTVARTRARWEGGLDAAAVAEDWRLAPSDAASRGYRRCPFRGGSRRRVPGKAGKKNRAANKSCLQLRVAEKRCYPARIQGRRW